MEAKDATERWVSVEQIAAHLGVENFTIYTQLGRKDMPVHKVGLLWRFKISEVDRWVKSGGAGRGSSQK